MLRFPPFLALLVPPVAAQELPMPYQELTPPAAEVTIPIQLAGPQILIDGVYVNGEGPLRFLLDTGAMGGGRVDVTLAERLRLEATGSLQGSDGSGRGGQEMQQYVLDELAFGGLVFRGVHVASRDYNLHGTDVRGPIDGILGIGLFEELLLTIDYPGRELRVAKGELPEGEGTLALSEGPVPTFTLELGGAERTARLDTGNMGGLTVSQEIAEALAFRGEPVEIGQARTVSGSFPIRSATLAGSVALGGAVVEDPEVVIVPLPDVNLGGRFLRDFELTLDQAHGRARFVYAPRKLEGAPARTALRGATSVPLRMVMGRPVVDVRIGERSVAMIADTGAATTILFPSLVEELALEATGTTRVGDPTDPRAIEASTYDLAQLALGEARFEGLRVVSWEDEMTTSPVLGEVRGILGLPLFTDLLVTYDFPRGELLLSRGALGRFDGSLPLRYDQGVPTVDLTVGDETIDLHLDTGNPGGLVLPGSIASRVAWSSAPQLVGRARSPSGTFDIQSGTLEEPLALAGYPIEATVQLTDGFTWANVGSGWLKDFALLIDLTNERVLLGR